jgi:hypothetical protein
MKVQVSSSPRVRQIPAWLATGLQAHQHITMKNYFGRAVIQGWNRRLNSFLEALTFLNSGLFVGPNKRDLPSVGDRRYPLGSVRVPVQLRLSRPSK